LDILGVSGDDLGTWCWSFLSQPYELVVILRLRGCLLIQSIGFFKLIPMHLLPCLIASVNAMEEAMKV
jgi:hypothetical protein